MHKMNNLNREEYILKYAGFLPKGYKPPKSIGEMLDIIDEAKGTRIERLSTQPLGESGRRITEEMEHTINAAHRMTKNTKGKGMPLSRKMLKRGRVTGTGFWTKLK
jgi:hypothetical protein